MTTARDVLEGRALWSCERADCIELFHALPDDSIDLLFTSPPYRKARTYGIDAGRDTEKWVAWMVELVRAASPKVKGLIAINCNGQTEDYAYHPTPHLLEADLYRAGFNMRRPAYFHRVGIPGSGGPDWLRGDIEPIICITRPGKLPWSDNTACGHPPKWAPGGEMSNRLSDGTRVNQWGKMGSMTGTTATGNKEKPRIGKPRPSHVTMTKGEDKPETPSLFDAGPPAEKPHPPPKMNLGRGMRKGVPGSTKGGLMSPGWTKADKLAAGAKRHTKRDASPQANGDAMREQAYLPPVLANPGCVIQQHYTADEVAAILAQASEVVHCNVGGGQMGHALAHENEAPFPLDLAVFFVKSFCPPGGVVCDPFSGSGTTCDAAVQHGRRFIGCDLRQSQADLCARRMRTVTPPLFNEVA